MKIYLVRKFLHEESVIEASFSKKEDAQRYAEVYGGGRFILNSELDNKEVIEYLNRKDFMYRVNITDNYWEDVDKQWHTSDLTDITLLDEKKISNIKKCDKIINVCTWGNREIEYYMVIKAKNYNEAKKKGFEMINAMKSNKSKYCNLDSMYKKEAFKRRKNKTKDIYFNYLTGEKEKEWE